ncbi:hypothetical protein [Halorubrum laminariae]|uniref:Uncharacterized protein n=1 Tax=Halorubrum laminariae TaxID=1433523 RepID=A0ABD6BZ48_9EURY|nr:hypothetical protein [Halorubrum laminariae]
MSARNTPEPECIETSETTSPHQTDIQLVADRLARNGIEVINTEPESNPHLEVATSKNQIESIQTLLEDTETDQQYRIITPTDTNTLPEWPTSNTGREQLRTVFITPQSEVRFTPKQKGILRASYL